MQIAVAFMAMIQFPDTRLHGRLGLERGDVWFLEKELSHWTIHFPETRLHYTVAILQEHGVSAYINH